MSTDNGPGTGPPSSSATSTNVGQHGPPGGLQVQRLPIASLHLDPGNARAHGEENLAAVRASLERFGQVEPLVVRASDRRVIGGNARLTAMAAMGWTSADCVLIDLDDAQAAALGIALNRTAEMSTWDETILAKTLADLRASGDLIGVGFEPMELDERLGALGLDEFGKPLPEGFGVEPIPPPVVAITRVCDLWVLGAHKLLCGDSSVKEDLDRLLGGAPVHLLNTDPPYNVRVEPRSNNAIAAGLSSFTPDKGRRAAMHHQQLDLARHPGKAKATGPMRAKDRQLENDFISEAAFGEILLAWFGNAARVLIPGRGFYIWGGYSNLINYPSAIRESGLYFSQGIIWVKEHPVLTRKDFMGNHEWCFYGWKEGGSHQFFGPHNATDVWSVKKVNPQSMVHLTEKPVELAMRAMEYSSRLGENVLDLFGGSGSTLIAAEQSGRNAFLMEIDGPYCDVIIDRWQRTTGKSATLGPDGPTWDAVKSQRLSELPTQETAPVV